MGWTAHPLPSAIGDAITGGVLAETVAWGSCVSDGARLYVFGEGAAHSYLHTRSAAGVTTTVQIPDGPSGPWDVRSFAVGAGRLVLLVSGQGSAPPMHTLTTDDLGAHWAGPFDIANPNGTGFGHQWVPGDIAWNGSYFCMTGNDNWSATSPSGQAWTAGPLVAGANRLGQLGWTGAAWFTYDAVADQSRTSLDGRHWSAPTTPAAVMGKVRADAGGVFDLYISDLHVSVDYGASYGGAIPTDNSGVPAGSVSGAGHLALDPLTPGRALQMMPWDYSGAYYLRLTVTPLGGDSDALAPIAALEGGSVQPAAFAGPGACAFLAGKPTVVLPTALYIFDAASFWTGFIGCEEA